MVVLFDRIFLFDSFRAAAALRWRLYLGLMLTWLVLAFQLAAASARRLCWIRYRRQLCGRTS